VTYEKRELEIVELTPDTHKEIRSYENLTRAAHEKDVSKQALYQAIKNAEVCAGSRWVLRKFYSQ